MKFFLTIIFCFSLLVPTVGQPKVPEHGGVWVHVQLDGIGETILKWFGAMRTLDITSF
jgi:hypothetical protein